MLKVLWGLNCRLESCLKLVGVYIILVFVYLIFRIVCFIRGILL